MSTAFSNYMASTEAQVYLWIIGISLVWFLVACAKLGRDMRVIRLNAAEKAREERAARRRRR